MENTRQPVDVDAPTGEEQSVGLPAGLLARMKADPAHAPEYLSLAAVERFGPDARQWLAKNRVGRPWIVDDVQWVPVIQARFVRLSQASGAAAGVTGPVGAVVDVGVLAWNQARMVLCLAAAHGLDPTHPDRAADLLLLRGIQTKLDAARTAIDVARKQQDLAALQSHLPAGTNVYAMLAWQLARMAGLATAKRLALKVIPFAGVPLGALANSNATKKLAKEATSYYAQRRPPSLMP